MSALAELFRPIVRIAPGGGPTKAIPAFRQRSAKPAFSERNPYPGCRHSAPASSASAMIASWSRYPLAPSPISWTSSARRVNSAPRSAGVCIAMERTPIRRAVRMIRQAISPRLAMRTLANISRLRAGSPGARLYRRQFRRVQSRERVPPGRDLHQPRVPGFDVRKIGERQACKVRERQDAGDAEIGVSDVIADEPVRRAEAPLQNGGRGRKFAQSR